MLGDTQPTTSGISQFGRVSRSQPPRNSQEGEEHGSLSSVSWGEVVRPVSHVTKLGGAPARVLCTMKAATLDPPGMEERVCDLLEDSSIKIVE